MIARMSQASATRRALPHVTGASHRCKAAPTKLTPLAVNIMLASGALSTRRQAAVLPKARFAGAMALLATAAALFFAGAFNSTQSPIGQVPQAQATGLSAAVADQRETLAPDRQPEGRAAQPDPASAAGVVSPQDRFEIDRFIRLGAATR